MSVAKPRNRLVFFRVSEDDFQKLSTLCQSGQGARSISELARSAVHRLIADSGGERAVFITLEHLDKRIDDLQEQVKHLTSLLLTEQGVLHGADDRSALCAEQQVGKEA